MIWGNICCSMQSIENCSLRSVFIDWMYLHDIYMLSSIYYAEQHWVRQCRERNIEKTMQTPLSFNSYKRLCCSEITCTSSPTKSNGEGHRSELEALGRFDDGRIWACFGLWQVDFGGWGGDSVSERDEQRMRGACEYVWGKQSRMWGWVTGQLERWK